MATIQLRVDENMKKQAKQIFEKMGLDMSSAVKLFLSQVIMKKEIPFRITTENGLTKEEEVEILKRSKEMLEGKNTESFDKMDDAITWLNED